MMQPAEASSTILFFTSADVFAMARDNVTTGAKLTKVLIDGGLTGNMIPRPVVNKLRCRTVPMTNTSIETADGSRVQMTALVWITVVVANTTRVIAAIVVDGPRPPSYSLLLFFSFCSFFSFLYFAIAIHRSTRCLRKNS
jgi:hypothetical protein